MLNRYDLLSSTDSDIDIIDQQSAPSTPVRSPSLSSSSTESSYLSSQSAVPNTDNDSAINETVSVNTNLELDERVPETENTETMSNFQDEPQVSTSTIPSPISQISQEPDSTTTTANFSSADTIQAPTMSNSRPSPPQSDFEFKPPAIQKISTHNNTTQPAKIVNLSSQLPTTTTTTTTTGSSSSSDVQGRTFVSKGG